HFEESEWARPPYRHTALRSDESQNLVADHPERGVGADLGSGGYVMSDISDALARLRAEGVRGLPWELEMYCRNSSCPARTVEMTIKELPGSEKLRDALPCPSCRRPLALHRAWNANEAEEFRNRMAPQSDSTEQETDDDNVLWVRADMIAYRGEP